MTSSPEIKERFRRLAINRWAWLDSLNKKDPNITALDLSAPTGKWTGGIWIDPKQPHIVRYRFRYGKGRYRGQVITQDYFPV